MNKNKNFEIVSLNISSEKGQKKTPQPSVYFQKDNGIKGDAHAGDGHRQVSLLTTDSIGKMVAKGLAVKPGDFAENVTITGVELVSLPIGTRLKIADKIELEISQIGKVCHERCHIYYQAGDCVMPSEGVFAKVISGGKIKVGDKGIVFA